MFMDNHSTWTWTEQEVNDWTQAREAIRSVWIAASGRARVTPWRREKTALERLGNRVEAEHRLLECTDRDTVARILRDYPGLATVVQRGDVLKIIPEILGDDDADR